MRIVIALGGNALLRRNQPMTASNQRANIRLACERIAEVAVDHEVVVAHGNGPQVGLLALQSAAYTEVEPYPLDVLGAQTEAMIGYVIEQELGHVLPGQALATLLTQVEVARDDPAFHDPTKPIGPVYDRGTAQRLAAEHGWSVKQDGDDWRRVVASPRPQRILAIDAVRHLLERDTVVICAGGGGIPAAYDDAGRLNGIEAVIDKDLAASLLARELGADLLVIATDVDGIHRDFGEPGARRIEEATPEDLEVMDLPAGSMGPKAAAAAEFVRATGKRAAIGSLDDIAELVAGGAGTQVRGAR